MFGDEITEIFLQRKHKECFDNLDIFKRYKTKLNVRINNKIKVLLENIYSVLR